MGGSLFGGALSEDGSMHAFSNMDAQLQHVQHVLATEHTNNMGLQRRLSKEDAATGISERSARAA